MVATVVAVSSSGAQPVAAAALPVSVTAALDLPAAQIVSTSTSADSRAYGVGTAPIGDFPTEGSSYMILSTGLASDVVGTSDQLASTDLDAPNSLDGGDLTRVDLVLRPPSQARCLTFDFAFLTEPNPNNSGEYGKYGNDIFTAEINQSELTVDQTPIGNAPGYEVIAPRNFATDVPGRPMGPYTGFGIDSTTGTKMDFSTPKLSALTPVELGPDGMTMKLILAIQDGGFEPDSAVLIDNMRWLYGMTCVKGAQSREDTDGDAIPDSWETKGVDINNDGIIELDLKAMGADPAVKDIFIEVDAMVLPVTCKGVITEIPTICQGGKDFRPMQSALDDVVKAFAAAPGGPIRMHIDAGAGSTMNPVTGAKWGTRTRANMLPHDPILGTTASKWGEFDALKKTNFETARAEVFHYAVYADRYQGNTTDSSGSSHGIPGGDFMVTDGPWGKAGFTRIQERGTFMHELGHNLDLYHGGGKTGTGQGGTAYKSIMNYKYQLVGLPTTPLLNYSGGTPYDDWTNIRFDGGSVGGAGAAGLLTTTADDDELTYEQAVALGVLSAPGDGTVGLAGFYTFVGTTGKQNLFIDITNISKTSAKYTLNLTTGLPVDKTVSVTVGPESTTRVRMAVDTDIATPGTHPLTISMTSSLLDGEVSTTSADYVVINPKTPGFDPAAIKKELTPAKNPDLDAEGLDSFIKQIDEAFGDPGPAGLFAPLSPARLMETRAGEPTTVDGQFWEIGERAAGTVTELTVAGRGGVASDADAVVMNIAVTSTKGGGFVTAYPCGTTRPNASNLNYERKSQTIANAVTAKIGTGGKVCLYTSTATHIIVDVNGYYPAASGFVALSPARLMETRAGEPTTVDGQLWEIGERAAGTVTELTVAGRGGVASDADAVVMNIAVTSTKGGGFVTAYPCGTTRPNASNLNYERKSQTIANAVTAKIGTGGKVCLYTSTATHIIVDVNGYYPAASAFVALSPARLLETRAGQPTTVDGKFWEIGERAAGTVTELTVAGRGGVASDADAVVMNIAVTSTKGGGFVTAYPCGTTRPNASNLNYERKSQTIANAVTAKIGTGGKVCLYTSAATHIIVDVNGYYAG